MFIRRLWLVVRVLFVMALAGLLIAPDWPEFGDREHQLDAIVRQERRFDFLIWEVNAFLAKAEGWAANATALLSEDDQTEQVITYLSDLQRAQRLEAEIEFIYIDPEITDPESAAGALQAELDALRADLDARQPSVEAIVQSQVAAVLADEGLAIGGWTFPPVLMHITPLPEMLIISPRDRIEQVDYAALVPGISTGDKDAMEQAIYDQLDQSALVVPIGGLGSYPAMIRERPEINWLADTTAHEWAHHFLSLRPLGVRYLDGAAMRTINETVASIVGQEIGPAVVARYYPAFLPPEVEEPLVPERPGPLPDAPPAFNFGAELAETRNTVDALLADGKIDEAEAYMEARRAVFVEEGYLIRKMNQAFFAFYGGYATDPTGGAAGADPIGPMLREIREASPSLQTFLGHVDTVTSFDDLVTVYRAVAGDGPAAALIP